MGPNGPIDMSPPMSAYFPSAPPIPTHLLGSSRRPEPPGVPPSRQLTLRQLAAERLRASSPKCRVCRGALTLGQPGKHHSCTPTTRTA